MVITLVDHPIKTFLPWDMVQNIEITSLFSFSSYHCTIAVHSSATEQIPLSEHASFLASRLAFPSPFSIVFTL